MVIQYFLPLAENTMVEETDARVLPDVRAPNAFENHLTPVNSFLTPS